MSLYEDNILTDAKALSRFWDKVEVIHPDDPDACYGWNAKKDKNGCGIFCMYCPQLEGIGKRAWKSFRAPRLMWILEHNSDIPDGLLVIHSCDNESCTNPRHIRLGTHKDNANDRRLRGRFDTGPKGEEHPRAVLTAAKVRKICHLYFVKGLSAAETARKLDVSRVLVWGIISGKDWKHITKTHIPKGFLHKFDRCNLRNEKMYQSFKDGWSYKKISEYYNVNPIYTREILRKKRQEHGDKPTPLGFRSDRKGKR